MRLTLYRAAVGWRDPQGDDPDQIIESAVYPVASSSQASVLREVAQQIERGIHPALPPTAEVAAVAFLRPADVRDLAEMEAC